MITTRQWRQHLLKHATHNHIDQQYTTNTETDHLHRT